MRIVALSSQLLNGKDTVANFLVDKLNITDMKRWRRIAFAYAVKKIYMDAFDKDFDFVEEWKRKKEPPEGMDMNVRQSLQFIGDGFRQIQGDIWIQLALRDLGASDNVVISDGRYINEAKQVKGKGGYNILLWRPGFENDDPNKSEAEIKPLVEYCAKCFNYRFGGPICLNKQFGQPPFGLEFYDYFLINKGTLKELENEIETNLRVHVQNYFQNPNPFRGIGIMESHQFSHVKKGWGNEQWIWNGEYCGKILTFNKDKRCSWHYHILKDEVFYLLEGEIRVLYGMDNDIGKAEQITLKPGDVFHVPRELCHQMIALKDSKLIEFSTEHLESDSYRVTKGD